jgi:uncharacterized membrane protein YhiD involved in acid resistance
MNEAQSLFSAHTAAALSLTDLAINLIIAGVLAFGVGLHYRTFGATLASRETFTRVFPFIALTVCLLISIIKSSLALSLGLVGALSIVRFRTPVKEPEELAYVFLSITLGLGLGAGFRRETPLAVFLILGMVTLIQTRSRRLSSRNLYVNIGLDSAEGQPAASVVEPVNAVLLKHCRRVDLRRMDAEHRHVELTYFVDIGEIATVARLAQELEQQYPTVRVTLLDQGRMPSL